MKIIVGLRIAPISMSIWILISCIVRQRKKDVDDIFWLYVFFKFTLAKDRILRFSNTVSHLNCFSLVCTIIALF